MRRKQPEAEVEGGVPTWVLESYSILAAIRELGMREEDGDPRVVLARDDWSAHSPHARLWALRREREQAGRAWCAERGLSYSMTVLGLTAPSREETADGHVRGAGPKYAEALQRLGAAPVSAGSGVHR